jgi:hypothetical protein
MRSFSLSLILLAGVATIAHAQAPRITAPIAKAREAAANADARTKVHDDALEPAARKRDSVPVVSAPGVSIKTPAATQKAPDTTKAAKPGKSVAVASAPTGDKSAAPVPPPQVTPGKGKAPAGKVPAGTDTTTPATKPAPVTPGGAKPSAIVEAVKDAPPVTSVSSTSTARPEIEINREVFQYDAAGRRDPFVSLLLTSDLRPLFSDLLLVVINYDPQGRNSVAIMRDAATKEQYRVRQGQLIGRMRVAAIEPKRVMFTIDEFGFSRQETLVIGDTTKVRKQ